MNRINFDVLTVIEYEFAKNQQTYLLSDNIPTAIMINATALQPLHALIESTTDTTTIQELTYTLQKTISTITQKIIHNSYPMKTPSEIEEITAQFLPQEQEQIISFFLKTLGHSYNTLSIQTKT